MTKTLRLMLLTVLTMLCGSVFAAETVVQWVAAENLADKEKPETIVVDDYITFEAIRNGGTAPQYYANGESLRLYAKNTFTVKGADGVTIKKIAFTFGSGEGDNEITSDVPTYEDGTWTGESQEVAFTIGGKKGNRRVAAIEVTYDVAPAAPSTVTWDASSEDPFPNISVNNDINISSTDARYSTQSNKRVVSLAQGDKITVAGADENVTISQIVFTYVGDNLGLSPNVGSSTNNYIDNTSTWTGEANSITFTAGGRRYVKSMEITYTGSAAPVVKAPVLAITSDGIADTYDMDVNGVFVVYYENTGNAAAENAKLTLYVDGEENASKTLGTLNFGASTLNFWNAKYDVTNLEPGEHQVYLTMTADNAETFTTNAKTVTFTKKAPEATFSLTATESVNVEYGAESYQVTATVKNTSEVDATGVQVLLQRNAQNVADPQSIDLAAGEEKQVTFTVAGPFNPGQATLFVLVKAYEKNLAQQEVTITFAEAPVVDVKDLAVTSIAGMLDLANTTNNVRIIVQNNGNVDIADAPVTLTAGEATLGTATVTVNAGQTGWCDIAVASEGLTAGELEVTATVTVEEDANPEDNAMNATLTVKAVAAPEATLVLTAEDKEITLGEDELTLTVNVENTSDVDANDVNVNIIYNTMTIATKNIATLAAHTSQELVFTAADITFPGVEDITTLPAGTYNLSAMTDGNKFGTHFTLTIKEAVAPVVDIALVDIRGLESINLKEENTVQVWFTNNSNVDVENATITLNMNGTLVGTETIAKGESYKLFTLSTEGLVAGETAELVATLNVEGNKEGNTVEVTKTLPIVSGEVEPAAEVAINPISGWEVEAGEQTINVSVVVYNNGDADAQDVKVQLYKDITTILAEETIDIPAPAGEEPSYKLLNMSFDYTFEQGKSYEFTVYTNYKDAEVENNMQKFTITCPALVADLGVAKIADINATTEDVVKVNAVVKNNSTIDATEVKVGLYTQDDNFQYQLVGLQQTIETIAAGEEANLEFTIGQLAAGTYKYYVRIVTEDTNMDNNIQDVTVKVTEYVAPVVNVSLTAIQGISNIDLSAESNTVMVWVKNEGNVDVDAAVVTVKLNETELEAQTIALTAGNSANVSFVLPTEGLTAGVKATVVATVTVAENTAETFTLTREYDVIDSSVATEPVFEVTAENVEFELGTETFDVVATVKNTSSVAAENVEVSLFYNGVIASETIASLAGGEETTVTFADVANPFTKTGSYTMYVQAPKAQTEVIITVKKPYVEPVVDMAVTAIQGTLDLTYESGIVTVTVENKGNQDVQDAVVKLTTGETELGEKAVSVKAGETGYAIITVATEGLEAGTLTVTAAVTVEGDANAEDNTLTQDITVKAADAAQPTFSVTAENVSVEYGLTSFDIVATVKNTSEVDATDIEVKLLKGIAEADAKTIEALAAGEETQVTFTVESTDEAPFVAGTTATYYVQVANKAQANVTVTFEEEPVEAVVDLAVTSINGTLSLDYETNYIYVYVENKGNVDVDEATVTLTAGEQVLGTGTVSVKVGQSKLCTIAVATENLTAGELTVTATVVAEGDADLTNNVMEKTYTLTAEPVLSFTAENVTVGKNDNVVNVNVTVRNTGKGDAENVVVKVYSENSAELGSATISNVPAGGEETVRITFDNTFTANGRLQVWVAGVEGVKWITVTVTETTAIEAIKAQYGENVKIYTLGGKLVNCVVKGGLYIINGKKVVIK